MKKFLMIAFLLLTLNACNKEKDYIFEVDPIDVQKDQIGKGIPKSTVEFLSIAYSDIFGSSITQNDLNRLSLLYLAFGDKKLLEDLLIKNMINRPESQLPTNAVMRADVAAFVKATYLKLYNREPNELEAYTLKKNIDDNADMTSVMVYYAMMTSDEYRYY
ncbi:MAG: hypothetical protein RLZZ543_679 [Bacteroidota bacterium]|jgi:hypothetical protein